MSNIAVNIKKLRESKAFSQEKLARLCNVANNTIVKIESGKNKNPTLGTLAKIAEVLGVSIDEIVS